MIPGYNCFQNRAKWRVRRCLEHNSTSFCKHLLQPVVVLSTYQRTANEMPCHWEWKPPCAFSCLWKCWVKWFKLHSHLTCQKERISHMLQCGFHMQWEMGIAGLQTKVLICPQSPRQCLLSRLLLGHFYSEKVCFSFHHLSLLPSFGFLSMVTQFLTPVSSWGFWKQIEVSSFLRSDALHQPAALPQLLPCITCTCSHTPPVYTHTPPLTDGDALRNCFNFYSFL